MPRFVRPLSLLATLALLVAIGQPTAAGGPDPTSRGVRGIEWAKSKFVQNPAFGAWKAANAEILARTAPLIDPLNSSVTQYVVEPEGSDKDDNSPRLSFTDGNYWNFCTAGAVAATMWYWNSTYVTGTAANSYIEPTSASTRVSTYWTSSDYDGGSNYYYTEGRNYLMYIAENVSPPSFSTAGEVTFSGSNVYGTLVDMRDALNWEASGRNTGTWSTYFYATLLAGSLSQTSLHNDIVVDTSYYNAPVVVITKTSGLSPNWSNGTVIHAVSVIGYDDTAQTYTYLDTCGKNCGASQNGGIYTVDQTTLYNGIQAAGSTTGGIDY
jgi:hypothetical protein